jgi:hypothetical protein
VEHVEVADAPVYQHGADFLEPQVPGQCLAAGDPLGQLQLGKERQLVGTSLLVPPTSALVKSGSWVG